jgi:hypothetical protein
MFFFIKMHRDGQHFNKTSMLMDGGGGGDGGTIY